MSVPKKIINDILNPRVVDKEKYISEDINYLKDIINKKANVIDMMSPGALRDELRGTFDPTQETYEEFLQRQSIPQMDRPLTGQAPSDSILETQRIDLNKGGRTGFKLGDLAFQDLPEADTDTFLKRIVKTKKNKYWPFRTNTVLIKPEDLNNAFLVRNYIAKNKGMVPNVETLANEIFGMTKAGKPINKIGAERALLLAMDSFKELEDFQFSSQRFPKVSNLKWKYLDMVAKSFANYKTAPFRDEALANLLPKNMGMNYSMRYDSPYSMPKLSKELFKLRSKLTPEDLKYVSAKVSSLINQPFSVEDAKKAIDDAELIRGQEGRLSAVSKINDKMIEEIKKLSSNKNFMNLLEKPFTKEHRKILLNEAANLLKQDVAVASRRIFQLGEAMSSTTNAYKGSDIPINDNVANKIINTGKNLGGRINRYAMSDMVYEHYANVIDKTLNSPDKRKFINYYQKGISNLLDQGKVPDEIFSVTASARRGLAPYAIFTQILDADVNSKIKGAALDSRLSTTHRRIQEITKKDGVVRNYDQLNANEKKLVDGYVKTYEQAKADAIKNLKPEIKKNIQLPEFDFKNPPSKSIVNYSNLDKNLQNAFDNTYKNVGYSMKVPKNFLTQKQMLSSLTGANVPRGSTGSGAAGYALLGGMVLSPVIKGFLEDVGVMDKPRGVPMASLDGGKYIPEESSFAEDAALTALGGATVFGGGLAGKKLIEKTTGQYAPMIKGVIGKALQSPFALPFRATGLDRMAMKKLGLLPEDQTLAQTYDPRTASGRTALGLEATTAGIYKPIAEGLTSWIKNPTAKNLATGILKLGPRSLNLANVLSKVARVTTPLGITSLLGEGAYQLLVKPQKEYLESLDPEERKTVEQQYADVAAAEGGIIRKAYKDAGLVEKLGRGAAAFDPRNLPYYGAKTLKGLGSGVEMAVKFPVAAGAAIGETIQKGPRKETLTKFGEAMLPSATQYLSEKTGLESLIKGQEKELLEKRPGAVAMGDVLELGAEFVAPATGYIKMIEDSGSKLYKVLRNSQEGKKIDPKDIDEVLEVLSDKGVGRRDFMAVVGGTSALALAKHIGIVDALKILEKAKPIKILSRSSSKMPEWFPNFASRILDDTDSVFKQVDEDMVEITNKNLPDVSIGKYSNGRWEISGYNEYGQPYIIDYQPPSILEDGTKYAGDFSVFDNVPSRMGPDDVEFDSELVESIDDVLGGTSKLEEWTTGVKKKEPTRGEKRVIEAEGRADAEYDAWKESEDFGNE